MSGKYRCWPCFVYMESVDLSSLYLDFCIFAVLSRFFLLDILALQYFWHSLLIVVWTNTLFHKIYNSPGIDSVLCDEMSRRGLLSALHNYEARVNYGIVFDCHLLLDIDEAWFLEELHLLRV